MSQLKYQYGQTEAFPAWTDPQPAILEPLRLPEKEKTPVFEEKEIECLLCEEVFNIPYQQQEFLKHLLSEHKFVIGDVNIIADLPAYVRYWKNKFRTCPLTAYCTTMRAEVALDRKEVKSKEEEFFFLSDIVPEDKELRMQLQRERLDQVLAVQETERNDATFNRGCLFCRKNFSEKYCELFNHMAFDHNFSVGQPDNLVFVNQFLDLLEKKLELLCCLFCEKIFKSRDVLKEHMRKKAHKRLNPSNKEYDRFYLVNYLEFGKTWEDVAREGMEDEMPTGWEDSDKEDDADWNDWRGDLGGAVCLFCNATYQVTMELQNHMKLTHGFDFQQLRSNLSFYQQVKLVNYIRRQVHLNTCIGCQQVSLNRESLLEHMTWTNHMEPGPVSQWDQPEYYFPTYENDYLLYALEDLNDCHVETEDTGICSLDSMGAIPVLPEDFPVKESILAQEDLRRSLLPGKRYSYSRSKSRDTREPRK